MGRESENVKHWLASWFQRIGDSLGDPPAPRVFVTGMPKSGTTAVARLMGIASGQQTVSDPFHLLDKRGVRFRDALFAGETSVPQLMRKYPSVFRGTILKDPNFAFFANTIAEAYPDAQWVFTVRDPRDNIRSVLNRLRLPGKADQIELQDDAIGQTWRRVLEGRTPEIRGDDPIHRLAVRWVTMAEIALASGRMTISRYEQFNADKQAAIAELCEAAGLMSVHSIAPYMDTQFQPRGNRNAVWEEFFGQPELAMILDTCGPTMARLGYDPGGGVR